ncbi:kinase-like domain-containing protein [Gymnopilus junonius]|uniref:Kinase-like domain-containing protein n=1 Tax=Gymnopilus junonius TaxID=109634 RepID=A0A9P5NWI3_GYMJU|nr:kinase-like domain-containing protein [Gymnopilus junonius]
MIFAVVSSTNPTKARQIVSISESFNDDGFSKLEVVWTENSQVFVTYSSHHRLKQFDDHALFEAQGTLFPKEKVYPSWRENITEMQRPLASNIYTKMAYCQCLNGEAGIRLIDAEIDVLEALSTNPHPNIVEYHGCIREEDYMVGICLSKYRCTLNELIRGQVPPDQRSPFDPDTVISGVMSGLTFLHGLGLVHDDINPHNIMLNDEGHAVIIDFDSCTHVGAESRGGTPGWSTNPTIAQVENDEYGLDLIVQFIRGEYNGENVEPFGL